MSESGSGGSWGPDCSNSPNHPIGGVTKCKQTEFQWGSRTYIMGIVNVTPDSFSGDGLGSDVEAAVAQGKRFVAEGADILDIGGESSRPGESPAWGTTTWPSLDANPARETHRPG